MNKQNDKCLLFFVKYPAGGQVKTRLCADLGAETAIGLYKNFVLDLLSSIETLNVDFEVYFHPNGAKAKLVQWLGEKYSYRAQLGKDLGERMKNAFQRTFDDNFARAIIIGSDSPDLPVDYINLALLALLTYDAVIGPAEDGGYYLIGYRRTGFLPEAFDGIIWSGESVCEQTIRILRRHKRRVSLLPQWYDVDTPTDLKSLLWRNRNTAFSKSGTIHYLMEHKLGESFNV
ncbi:MAG: TIGR04282 family arsenosugar biosynthesis glycosyltransferase [Planctomycetota bacterium]